MSASLAPASCRVRALISSLVQFSPARGATAGDLIFLGRTKGLAANGTAKVTDSLGVEIKCQLQPGRSQQASWYHSQLGPSLVVRFWNDAN